MSNLRPLFALALLAVAIVGTVLAPAVHWAGHGLSGHGAPFEAADGAAHLDAPDDDRHAGECPNCAHLQKVLGSEPAVLPFYAGVVGMERAVAPPEAPAFQADIATPEGRGPPTAA